MKKFISFILTLSLVFGLATLSFATGCAHPALTSVSYPATCAQRAYTVFSCADCGYTHTEYALPETNVSASSLYFTVTGALEDGKLTVNVEQFNNPGLCAVRFTLNFDNTALSPSAFTNGSAWNDYFVSDIADTTRKNIKYYAFSDRGDLTTNGLVFTLEFDILNADASKWGFSVTTDRGDFINTDYQKIPYTVECVVTEGFGDHVWDGGRVSLEPTLREEGVREYTCIHCAATRTESIPVLEGYEKGDINGDGSINISDLFVLKRILSSGGASEEANDAADIDASGSINITDLFALKRILTS